MTVTPHFAFVLDRRLAGPEVTAAQALRAVGAVHGALSRPGSPVLTGPVALSLLGLDLDLEAVLVEVDGQVVDSGAGAGLPGGPAAALVTEVARLAAEGRALEPGDVVLTGPLTAPVPSTGAGSASVSVHFTHLGSLYAPASEAV
jgi:2-oxo-3-hexenedioate decarboxylase